MAKEAVKIGTGKEFYHVQAVANSKGYLKLERGKFASIYYNTSKKKLVVKFKVGNESQSKTFSVEEWQEANDFAQRANEQGEQSGKELGTNSPEEETARRLWRRFVEEQLEQGVEVRSLVDVISEAIEREKERKITPLFSDVALRYFEEEKNSWSETWRKHRESEIKRLRKTPVFSGKMISEIIPADVDKAILDCVSNRLKGDSISPRTLRHWKILIKAIFDWFFDLENSNRAPSDQIKNPLARYSIENVKNTDEPETLSVSDTRKLLLDLWENERFSVPVVATQMFAGVRPHEAMRIRWRYFRNDFEVLYLPKAITKGRVARSIPVSPNLKQWLKFYCLTCGVPAEDSFLANVYFDSSKSISEQEHQRLMKIQHAIERSTERTGVKRSRDVFRHTAVSAFCAYYSEIQAQQWAGHSIKILLEFYKAEMSLREAEDYFSIMPPVVDGSEKTVVFDRSAKRSQEDSSQEDSSGETTKEEKASNA